VEHDISVNTKEGLCDNSIIIDERMWKGFVIERISHGWEGLKSNGIIELNQLLP